jgi:hypothetical protein
MRRSHRGKHPGGRPTLYRDKLAGKVCEEIADRKTLVAICEQKGMPSYTAEMRWLHEHEEFEKRYARARQERFIERYLISLNATRAHIEAGYSPKTARYIGAENLTKPNIAAEQQASRTRGVCAQLCAREEGSVRR